MSDMNSIVDEAALIMAVQERDFYKQEWARLILYCATLEQRNDALDRALRARSDSVSGRASIVVRAGGSNDNKGA
jgi:hypothetical protein